MKKKMKKTTTDKIVEIVGKKEAKAEVGWFRQA